MKEKDQDKYEAPAPEKETGIKDELKDHYIDDRPAQPEYINSSPEYFDNPPEYAGKDPIYANDIVDERSNDIIHEEEDAKEDKPKGCRNLFK